MNANLAEAERFINEYEAAELIRASVHTLRGQRHARRGLPFYKIGRSVRYKLSDILRHMETLRVETTPFLSCDTWTPAERAAYRAEVEKLRAERQRTEAEARAAGTTKARGFLDGLKPATKEGRQRIKGGHYA